MSIHTAQYSANPIFKLNFGHDAMNLAATDDSAAFRRYCANFISPATPVDDLDTIVYLVDQGIFPNTLDNNTNDAHFWDATDDGDCNIIGGRLYYGCNVRHNNASALYNASNFPFIFKDDLYYYLTLDGRTDIVTTLLDGGVITFNRLNTHNHPTRPTNWDEMAKNLKRDDLLKKIYFGL